MRRISAALRLSGLALFAMIATHGLAVAQERDFSKVEIKTEKLTDSVYVLFGSGGNIGLSVGDDGVVMIDDQFAPLSVKILAAVRQLTDKPLRFVINTHWHGDHTGGNENMREAGGAIVAHENVRKRLATEQSIPVFNRTFEPRPPEALPHLTYADGVTLHFNGDDVRVIHVPRAHTDGDSIVHFTGANVIHAGDLFFNGFYPFIDAWSGGSIDGVIAAADMMIGLANEETKIIPGHGPMATRADLVTYRDMLTTVRDRVARAKTAGESAEKLVKSGAFTDIEKDWGGGFLNTEKFVTVVYAGLP